MAKAYEAVFRADNGRTFAFGPSGGNHFMISFWEGLPVEFGTSQGYGQIGETVQTQSVSGRPLDVTGEFYGDIAAGKARLRSVCAPGVAGRLTLNGDRWIRVYVKESPSVSPHRQSGLFKLQFFAPYPYFRSVEESYESIGSVRPMFRFPINYAQPHKFGERSAARYTNVINGGDVPAAFRLEIRSDGMVSNPAVTNIQTFQKMKLNGSLTAGEYIVVFRDDDNVLRAEKHSGDVVSDVISWVDESTDLWELDVGDNLILANDDNGGASMTVSITFSQAEVVLFET